MPTFQSARIEPGFRVDAGVTALADQPRNGSRQAPDYILALTPAYGFGRRFEAGVSIGLYGEGGLRRDEVTGDANVPMIMPYGKVAVLGPDSRHHLAITTQLVFAYPAIVSVHYGRDLGAWEPQVGIAFIRSGGPAGDDPVVTRYQQESQSLVVASIGATLNRPRRPSLEIGVLRNSYASCDGPCPAGSQAHRTTLLDLFAGLKVSVSK